MEHKFKVGDRVRCIRGDEQYLSEDRTYTITAVSDEMVGLDDYESTYHRDNVGDWYPDRFELVGDAQADDSQLKSVATTKVVEHHSEDAALEKVVAHLVNGAWVPEPPVIQEYTGGSSSYYKVNVGNPVSGGIPYVVECQDVIEALDMSFSEGNIFKAIWRICAAKKGKAKKGYEDSVYDLEKIIFFAQRELQIEKMKRSK